MCPALSSRLARIGVLAGLSMLIAACSGDPMVPPGEIDGAAEVSSIAPVANEGPADLASDIQPYPSADQPVSDNESYLRAPDVAAAEPRRLPKIDEDPAPAATELRPGDDGSVNIDAALGVGTIDNEYVGEPGQTVGLAEEQAGLIAEGQTESPLVDGIGTEAPVDLSTRRSDGVTTGPAEDAGQITLPGRRTEPEEGQQVAFIPRFSDPMQIPESYGGMSAQEKSCRQELKKLGVRFADLEPIRDGAACGIPHPVELEGLAGGITVKPAAKLNCKVALAFAKWVKYELVPSSRFRYLSGIKTIHQMSSYSCRRMNSSRSNPWSEHARGNAIDIGRFVLKSGKTIDVRKKSIFSFRERGLLKAVRADSCKYFTTVLGPGSDRHHKDHFHFDLRTRKSGYRHCDL